MGASYGVGFCGLCDKIFRFSPMRVPIIRAMGERHPICRACMETANLERTRRGLEMLDIPDGAYEPDVES